MTAPPCPICDKPRSLDYRPFCSRRCANVDLQRWLTGGYAIAGDAEDDRDEGGEG
jgi:endogenous inhibitor of DNA gyrase (YacG/DUF329 family)